MAESCFCRAKAQTRHYHLITTAHNKVCNFLRVATVVGVCGGGVTIFYQRTARQKNQCSRRASIKV
jgi:hypothetical protein